MALLCSTSHSRVNYRPSACCGIAVFALLRPWYTYGRPDSTRSTYDGLAVYHLVASLLTTTALRM